MKPNPILSVFIIISLCSITASAADFCVANSTELDAALDAAEANGESDIIRLIKGTYVVPPGGFYFGSSEPYGLIIEGDYTEFMSDCARFTPPTPWDTILTGDDLYPVLRLDFTSDQHLNAHVASLTIQDGLYTGAGQQAAGLSIIGWSGNRVSIEIENCLFLGNEGTNQAGALAAVSEKSLRLINNFFIGNQSGWFATASLFCNGIGVPDPCIEILNNTVTGNTTATGHGGILVEGSCASCFIDNNILYGNDNDDLFLNTAIGLACRVNHNDIQDYSGTPHSMTGNMSVYPEYVGFFNFHLAPDSPLVDAGIKRLSAPLPPYDADGLPRIVGPAIDIGAFERQTLFHDGFENGSTSYWDATVQ